MTEKDAIYDCEKATPTLPCPAVVERSNEPESEVSLAPLQIQPSIISKPSRSEFFPKYFLQVAPLDDALLDA